jgi:hypothetical protein
LRRGDDRGRGRVIEQAQRGEHWINGSPLEPCARGARTRY